MDEWMKLVVSALQEQLGELYEVEYLGGYEVAVVKKGDQAVSVSLEEGINENLQYLVDAGLAARYLLEQFERKYRVITEFLKYQDDYAFMKNHIIFRLVSRAYADSRLCINDTWLDASIVYDLAIEDDDEIYVRPVEEEDLKRWNVTKEDIRTAAKMDTPRILPPQLLMSGNLIPDKDWSELPMKEQIERSVDPEVVQVILTNRKVINGAGCILYEDVLKLLADAWQADIFIIPSSVHETILMPVRDDFLTVCEVQKMHLEVLSEEEVYGDEFLSDNIYRYDRRKREITIAACGKTQAEGLIS